MARTDSSSLVINNNPPRKGRSYERNNMLTLYIVAHMVAFELSCDLVLTEDKDKKTRTILRICEGMLAICLVASFVFY